MFEIFGQDVSPTRPESDEGSAIVRYGIHPWADSKLTDEFYHELLEMDATKFHVYAHEWTPTHIDFFVDNQKIRTIHQSPDYPMQFMLSIYELPGAERTATYPKEFVVDYVRAYQPEGGY